MNRNIFLFLIALFSFNLIPQAKAFDLKQVFLDMQSYGIDAQMGDAVQTTERLNYKYPAETIISKSRAKAYLCLWRLDKSVLELKKIDKGNNREELKWFISAINEEAKECASTTSEFNDLVTAILG